MACAWDGCQQGWLLLDHLHSEIGSIHKGLEDNESNELSDYNRGATLAVCADVPCNEIWENVKPGLDRILSFGRPQEEIEAII